MLNPAAMLAAAAGVVALAVVAGRAEAAPPSSPSPGRDAGPGGSPRSPSPGPEADLGLPPGPASRWYDWRDLVVSSKFPDAAARAAAQITPRERAQFSDLAQVLDTMNDATPEGRWHVNSGYRSRELNTLIGGDPHSQHMAPSADEDNGPAAAADLEHPQLDAARALEILGAVAPDKVDKAIAYVDKGHAHVSTRTDGRQRGMWGIHDADKFHWYPSAEAAAVAWRTARALRIS